MSKIVKTLKNAERHRSLGLDGKILIPDVATLSPLVRRAEPSSPPSADSNLSNASKRLAPLYNSNNVAVIYSYEESNARCVSPRSPRTTTRRTDDLFSTYPPAGGSSAAMVTAARGQDPPSAIASSLAESPGAAVAEVSEQTASTKESTTDLATSPPGSATADDHVPPPPIMVAAPSETSPTAAASPPAPTPTPTPKTPPTAEHASAPPPPPPPPPPGLSLLDFNAAEDWKLDVSKLRIDKKIGQGAFGEVFKGEYLGTPVAVKSLITGSISEDVDIEFKREVSILKSLRHPNIVLFMGIAESDNKCYIVQEFVCGGAMNDLLADKTKPLPWLVRVKMATEIACALAYLHLRGCLHRDLKAENVLIGENFKPKVADFGLAIVLDRKNKKGELEPVGSPWWRAPEVNEGNYDSRADIFSYGIVLAEMFSRAEGEDLRLGASYIKDKKTMTFGFNTDILGELIKEFAPDCPPSLLLLAQQCSKENPSERPGLDDVIFTLNIIHNQLTERERLIEATLPDAESSELWRFLTAGTENVDASASCQKVVDVLARRIHDKTKVTLEPYQREFLLEVVVQYADDEEHLSLFSFSDLYEWFIEIEKTLTSTLVLPLWRVGFVHGFISKGGALSLLSNGQPNSCIVRLSVSRPGEFVVTYIADDEPVDVYVASERNGLQVDSHLFKSFQDAFDKHAELKTLKYIHPAVSLHCPAFMNAHKIIGQSNKLDRKNMKKQDSFLVLRAKAEDRRARSNTSLSMSSNDPHGTFLSLPTHQSQH
mmetsp:Transcript_34369/g.86279  ORF Transcript_34369/g.86279 Transcript_34369/m.86279 type:complete len:769 (+) Transcript_34369:194-2500(+)|eukprot:CAMPEP_0177657092 /NCGR_PEP_ID=MMETSP0447-20121125/15981_1 /TAXON_ID=0 /ORGANISM="Stygamoeba regulata, Strain BSH-02190019" /LENGTH=768 /DNA_ID=CAMNT_0019161385 /DNA_START=136 /DNA_END=2442 /DNA_ORIENTATION=-